ncbi:hypothetical protein BDW62DRAFT_7332 [Aspergillus aurantiobrunneus]
MQCNSQSGLTGDRSVLPVSSLRIFDGRLSQEGIPKETSRLFHPHTRMTAPATIYQSLHNVVSLLAQSFQQLHPFSKLADLDVFFLLPRINRRLSFSVLVTAVMIVITDTSLRF